MNVAAYLDAPAREDPGRVALILDDGSTCTYGELAQAAGAWAAAMHAGGVTKGDRVALVDWAGVRATAATFAAAHLGAASAHMNPLLTPREIDELRAASGCVEFTIGGAAPGGVVPPRVDGTEAIVLFTSGTTGVPKAVAITHEALDTRMRQYRPAFDPTVPARRSIMCMPSFHVGGIVGLILAIYGGDTTVIQPRFDAGRWLSLVAEHRPATAMLVPTMLARLLDHPSFGESDLSSLRLVSYGAAAAPVDLVRRAMEAMPGVGFANVFGQTETLGAYTTLTPDDHRDPRRIGSVGRAMPGVEIRVVEPGTDDAVADGEVGELVVRTPLNTTPGWLRTGDLAQVDADGYVYPSGRLSETINRGGEKFGPAEIASVVRAHPGVADAAVVGVPDAEMGERVGVALVAAPGGAAPERGELRAWCDGKLAPFKLPDVVIVVERLPYNELGKLPKRTVVQLIEEHRT